MVTLQKRAQGSKDRAGKGWGEFGNATGKTVWLRGGKRKDTHQMVIRWILPGFSKAESAFSVPSQYTK